MEATRDPSYVLEVRDSTGLVQWAIDRSGSGVPDPSNWTAATLAAGFTNLGAPNAPCRFLRDAAGVVRLQGVASKAGAYATYPGTLITTLPDGFRPQYELSFGGQNVNGGVGRVDVHTDGGVYVVGGSNFVALDGITFPADTFLTVVALGDSITNGFGATNAWPTQLDTQLGPRANVVKKGVNGDTLTQVEARRAADVNPWTPTYAILQAGVNDVMADATLATIQTRFTTTVSALAAAGISPIVCTLLPWKNYASYTPAREGVRQAVNAWLRSTAWRVVDVEKTMGDGASVPALKAAYDSGDGLHPNDNGTAALAAAVFAQVFASTTI